MARQRSVFAPKLLLSEDEGVVTFLDCGSSINAMDGHTVLVLEVVATPSSCELQAALSTSRVPPPTYVCHAFDINAITVDRDSTADLMPLTPDRGQQDARRMNRSSLTPLTEMIVRPLNKRGFIWRINALENVHSEFLAEDGTCRFRHRSAPISVSRISDVVEAIQRDRAHLETCHQRRQEYLAVHPELQDRHLPSELLSQFQFPLYQLFGDRFPGTLSEDGHNCTSYLMEKLQQAGVYVSGTSVPKKQAW